MKKLIFITAAIVMAGMGLRAQDISTDTLPCGQWPQTLYSQLQRLYFDMSDLEWDTKTSSTTTVTVTNVCSY